MKPLIKLIMFRGLLFLAILALGFYLGSLSLQKEPSPWRHVEKQIRESVKIELMANPELADVLTSEQMEEFLNCTMELQMKFLEASQCHPRADQLELCLDKAGFRENIDKVNDGCLKKVLKKP